MSACLDDGSAVQSAGQGEATTAFAEFVARCRPGLFRAVRRRLASDEDAEDITQEALLRTWRRRDEHADDTHRRNFAHMVAQQLVIDLYRRKDHQVEVRADFADDVLGSAPCPSEIYVNAEDRAMVGAALRALPEDQRSLLIDCDVHGLSLDELRTRYATTAEVLRYRRFRARKALRRQMEREAAPAFVPLFLFKLSAMVRNSFRWMQDMASTGACAPSALVVLATLSVVVSPSGAGIHVLPPTSTAPSVAAPLARVDRSANTRSIATRVSQAANVAAAHVVKSDVRAQEPARTPVSGLERRPNLCVDGACVPGDDPHTGVDVVTIHVPGPVGDRQVVTDIAPACAYVPDSPVADCHTVGDPDYGIEPPETP